ncbi:EamA family transporter [Candidatus Woesearchaeota archaeon]|nr:EamA family transporter [Candidatus Woesearchaeota archaeon]
MATKLWAMSLMFFITFLTSTAQIFWKFGSEKLSFDLLALITNWQIIAGILIYAVAGTLMIISFRGGDVSVLYPIVATSYIWVSILSIYFLNEAMNIFKWLGVFIIFSGIALIGYGSRESKILEGAG